jgi:hypothetical protein
MDGPPRPKITIEEIEACLCGEATDEVRARYAANLDDPSSDLNAMLECVRRDDRLGFFRPHPPPLDTRLDQTDGEPK